MNPFFYRCLRSHTHTHTHVPHTHSLHRRGILCSNRPSGSWSLALVEASLRSAFWHQRKSKGVDGSRSSRHSRSQNDSNEINNSSNNNNNNNSSSSSSSSRIIRITRINKINSSNATIIVDPRSNHTTLVVGVQATGGRGSNPIQPTHRHHCPQLLPLRKKASHFVVYPCAPASVVVTNALCVGTAAVTSTYTQACVRPVVVVVVVVVIVVRTSDV